MVRSTMLPIMVMFFAGAMPAHADPSAIGNETPIAEHAPDKAATESADEAKPAVEFKIPPGYQAKKRGKKVLYCKKSMESGTRFAQERCLDEEQLRALQLEREQEQTAIEQSRKVCATIESCNGG